MSWQDVVTAALVGTQRQTLTLNPQDNQLGKLLRRLDSTDPEGALLGAAGAIALYQRAGRLPITDNQPLPTICEPDDLPGCSPRAGQQLALMLKGEHVEILPEWLATTAEVGKRVPERYLPELLALGQRHQLREAILPVLGKRGLWLAAQNPNWNYVVGEDEEVTWQIGSRAARLLLMQRLRALNPAAARERLAATWAEEGAEDRAAFLETLQTGLSMDDEPFLEEVLDDKTKKVRRAAANLLARLPKSQLCQRMTERVCRLLALTHTGDLSLDVSLPESDDKSMRRDGVELKPTDRQGEKSRCLLQMLAAVPPQIWCESWSTTPSQLVQIVSGNDWEPMLLEGWAIAAQRHQDTDWAEALLSVCHKFCAYLMPLPELIKGLRSVLPPQRWEAFILSLLQSDPNILNFLHPAFRMLHYGQHFWSAELTRVVLESVRCCLDNNQQYDWQFRSVLQEFARYMSPCLVHEAISLSAVVKGKSGWAEAVDEFLAIVQFRHEMLQAIRGES